MKAKSCKVLVGKSAIVPNLQKNGSPLLRRQLLFLFPDLTNFLVSSRGDFLALFEGNGNKLNWSSFFPAPRSYVWILKDYWR